MLTPNTVTSFCHKTLYDFSYFGQSEAGKEILQPNQTNFSIIDRAAAIYNEKKKKRIMPNVSKYPNWNLSLPNYVSLNFSKHWLNCKIVWECQWMLLIYFS